MQKELIQGYRVSPQQRRLWLLQQQAHNPAYSTQCAVVVEGSFSQQSLQAALQDVISRHEILRTAFHRLPEFIMPVQVINDDGRAAILHCDLSGLDPREQGDRIEALFDEGRRQAHVFDRGSALHMTVAALSPSTHLLLISIPALYGDAAGLRSIVDNLVRAYMARSRGECVHEDSIQYADVSEFLNDLLESNDTEAGREFWRRPEFSDSMPLPLPFENQPSGPTEFEPRSLSLTVDPALKAAMDARVAQRNVSPSTFLLACWHALLWRLTGQPNIVVGAAFDGRTFDELAGAVGLFTRYLPLPCGIGEGATFLDILEQLNERERELHKWQDAFDFERIETAESESTGASFFRLGFDFERQPMKLFAGGTSFSIIRQNSCLDRFKLRLSCFDRGDDLIVEFHYDSTFFHRESIQLLAERFSRLLRSAVDSIESSVSEMEVVGETERQQLLVAFNDTEAGYSYNECVHHLFEQQAARTPGSIAVACGGDGLTYADLNARANRLARHLIKMGVGPDTLVGIYTERSLEMVVALLGTLKAGAAYVPLDPSYPRQRVAFMLEDARASVLLTRQHLVETLPSNPARILRLDSDWKQIALEDDGNLPGRATPADLAYVIYTSGSTGNPKGVMISHSAICNRLLWMQEAFPVNEADRLLQKTPFSFDASVWEFFVPLLNGATVILAEPGGHQDSAYLARMIDEQNITVLQLVPSLLAVLLQESGISRRGNLRRVFCGGEALSAELQNRFHDLMDASLQNLYGPTEASIDASFWRCQRDDGRTMVPIGRPIANVQIYLLDPDLRPVPAGVPGELHIGGAGLARGYLDRPDLTAERFVPSPFSLKPGERLYKTGDLGRYLFDGSIEYLGRADHQVKIRGYRIELGEIESALKEHSAVRNAVVVAFEDRPGHKRLAAYLVGEQANNFAPDEQLYRLPNGLKIAHLNKSETDFIYKEVFEDAGYLKHGVTLWDGDCVFDVGANIGMFTLYVKHARANAQVYAFEPTPALFDRLRANAAMHDLKGRLYACGLSDRSKAVEFTFYPRMSSMSGVYADRHEDIEVSRAVISNQDERLDAYADDLLEGRFEKETFMAEMKTLSEVIRENNITRIDLLKVDVEKSEMDVLNGIEPEDWGKIKQIVIEAHDIDGRVERITGLLEKYGFEFVVEQDPLLQRTALYNIYAIHPTRNGLPPEPDRPARADSAEGLILPSPPRLTIGELREFLGQRLPDYMIPTAFIMLDALPLAPNGKLDRTKLPAPDSTGSDLQQDYAAPATEVEELLAQIWADVLGVEKVGRHANFFELGGDSILSIQIVSRANQMGLRLSPREIFKHQTIAGLATVAGTLPIIEAEKGIVTGQVPLTPIQKWFFEQRLADPHHFNQTMLFEVRQGFEPTLLTQAFQQLFAHHDALRLRFNETEGGWRQVNADLEEGLAFMQVNLSVLPESQHSAMIETMAAEAQASLSFSDGPLVRIVLFHLGKNRRARLLVVIHHLVVDGVSWRILLEDLHAAYDQLSRGEEVRLPAKTTSFKQWAEKLNDFARSADFTEEMDYWLSDSGAGVSRLPVDYRRGANTESSARTVRLIFSEEETRDLLQQAPQVYRAQMDEVLLAALAEALSRWSRASLLAIDLEGHGREEIIEGVDLSRTVGYFTTLFPVLVNLDEGRDVEASLKSVKEQMRRVPKHGIGYGLLRYLKRDAKIAEQLRDRCEAEISFNYLGRFDQVSSATGLLAPARESGGPSRSLRQNRRYLLEINGSVSNGRLAVEWVYSKNLHRRSTIRALADDFAESLRRLIAECKTPESRGVTPSDFPLANLDEDKLSKLYSLLEEID